MTESEEVGIELKINWEPKRLNTDGIINYRVLVRLMYRKATPAAPSGRNYFKK